MEQTEFFKFFFNLRLYGTSAEGLFLQPAKDVEFRTICLKSCRQEKKSMMHQGSLEPATI